MPITFKDYVERHRIPIVQCAYCGKSLSDVDVVWLSCCPVCKECYRRLAGL